MESKFGAFFLIFLLFVLSVGYSDEEGSAADSDGWSCDSETDDSASDSDDGWSNESGSASDSDSSGWGDGDDDDDSSSDGWGGSDDTGTGSGSDGWGSDEDDSPGCSYNEYEESKPEENYDCRDFSVGVSCAPNFDGYDHEQCGYSKLCKPLKSGEYRCMPEYRCERGGSASRQCGELSHEPVPGRWICNFCNFCEWQKDM